MNQSVCNVFVITVFCIARFVKIMSLQINQ